MSDDELLQAMSGMLEPIRGDIRGLGNRMERLEGHVERLDGRVENIEGDMQEIKGRVRKIELTQENVVIPRLNQIEACYTSTFERYQKEADTMERTVQDVEILKKVVTEHSKKLQSIS